ncbi:Beta-porphyranase A precursor [Planctomycetes bacterium MalM25]|nr:Beta-porphyranase A precursor [Planctomycetes bacterium MalM25]
MTALFKTLRPVGALALVALLLSLTTAPAQVVSVVADAGVRRFIGGLNQLERTKYFNHWGTHVIGGNTNLGDLATEVWAEDGLNSASGRDTWEFDSYIAQNIPQDPSRPGYFDITALRNFLRNGAYENFLNNSQRYESIRQHENHVYVQSGRAGSNWPSWLLDGTRLPVSHGGEAYGEFLNVYLEEVVYGTGPQIGNSQSQAYLPLDPENFYIEIMNEPSWELGPGGLDWEQAIEMHRNVTETVKSANPQAQIGGASVGNASFASWNPYRWDYAKTLMDDMTTWQTDNGQPAEFDFWTLHPYDSRPINSSGVPEHRLPESSGHLDGILDLFESYSHQLFGDPKRFAITEYGTIQWSENNGDFSTYPRRLLQWDEMTDIKKKMFTFMDRPDRIINATPFVAPQWWTGSSPTEHGQSGNVFWDRNADGTWTETINAGLYRMLNDVRGEYVQIESGDDEVQALAFRDGNQLHVILNSLIDSNRTVDLAALLGDASVTGATLDRVFWNGATGVFQDDLDVLNSWQSIGLTPEESVKLTLTYDESVAYTLATDRDTYYGDDTQTPINLSGGRSKVINLNADTEDAVAATVRVAISGRSNLWNTAFDVVVNGQTIHVPARGANGFDEHDNSLFSREVDVPVAALNDGANEVYVDFPSNGGDLVTATLIVTRSLGDYNGSGVFDGDDLALLFDQFGPTAPGSRYDLVADGVVDMEDVRFWYEELRGVATPTGDFNNDGLVDAADYSVIRDLGGAEFEFDYQYWAHRYGQAVPSASQQAVPEPSTLAVALLALTPFATRRRGSNSSDVTGPRRGAVTIRPSSRPKPPRQGPRRQSAPLGRGS